MIWTVTWHPAALRGFLSLPMGSAERLDRAILQFAKTGKGPVTRFDPRRLDRLKIAVPGALAHLFADEASGELVVGYVFQRR